jgi:hypothetical protein
MTPAISAGEATMARLERSIGALLVLSGLVCYAMWYLDQGRHGEAVFLWLYAIVAAPTGLGIFVAGQALHSQWPRRWWWQLGVALPPIVSLLCIGYAIALR